MKTILNAIVWTARSLWRILMWLGREYIGLWRRASPTGRAWLAGGTAFVLLVSCVLVNSASRNRPPAPRPTAAATAIAVAQAPSLTPRPSRTPLPTDTPGPSPTLTITRTPLPTSTPRPTWTPAPTTTPLEKLREQISGQLGEGFRVGADIERVSEVSWLDEGQLLVRFAISDALFESIAARAKRDVATILEAVDASDLPYDVVCVQGTFSMRDIYGNVSEDIVVNASYQRETLEKVNWSPLGFRSDDVYRIADSGYVHPDFR